MINEAFEWPTYACKKCGSVKLWEILKCKNQGGSIQFLFACCNCGHRTNHYIKHKVIQSLGIDFREVEPIYPRHKCAVCASDGAENHHWAPYALFGEESHNWPTSYLCLKCHKRWHTIVTPNISKLNGN